MNVESLSDFSFSRLVSFSLFFFSDQKQTKPDLRCAAHTLSMATTTTTPDDINAYDDDGRTKIFLAAEAGDAAEVARLLELKADVELPTTGFFRYLSLFITINYY